MKQIISTFNPHNGLKLKEYKIMDANEVVAMIQNLHKTQKSWKSSTISTRINALKKLTQTLLENKKNYAQIIHEEMGKCLIEAEAEVEKCASCANYYAEHADEFLKSIHIPTEAQKSYISFEPIGVVLAIMPWNFPFWQAFRAAIPAILAGNTVLLKHASNVSGCALEIEKIFVQSFSQNVLSSIIFSGENTLQLISNPQISGITFTGSTEVGKQISAVAGANLKKCVLELGGSDPYIIFDDADIDHAAKICAHSRLINVGQSCISAKRMIVHKNHVQKFETVLKKEMEQKTLAPMAREDLRNELHQQVEKSLNAGAKLICGGKIPNGPGYFYPQTVLSNVSVGMPAYEQELFGPVAAIIPAPSNEEAVRIANSSNFGLGAAIFSKNIIEAEKIAREQIEAGSVFVNNFVRSDSRLPFGGIKESGFGRELSYFGLREFTNIKTVWVD